jgi:ketosteroid isomerase-like protein
MSAEKEVVELEKQYWQAIVDRDIDKILSLTADPCIVAGAQGVMNMDHATYRKMMDAQPSWELLEFSLEGVESREVAPGVVSTAYSVSENMTVDGKPHSLKCADTSVWVKQGDTWVCVVHTEAILGDPFGRDRTGPPPKSKAVAKKAAARRSASGRSASRSSR